jgi:hypothetical protein
MSDDNRLKNICGCCSGIALKTPLLVENRPGRTSIEYRIGTHGAFFDSMRARLSAADFRALRNLKTRDSDDFSIALLDAWAMVLDILTFYQERLANESYLGTAQERFSLMELAKLVGYEINPGVSASTHIAFSMEDVPAGRAMPSTATIEAGTRLQSTPGQDELPQVFETDKDIRGRSRWNAIAPLPAQQQAVLADMGSVILSGISHRIKIGDRLLIEASGALNSMPVRDVTEVPELDHTRVDFANPALSPPTFERPTYGAQASVEDFLSAHGSQATLTQTTVDHLIGGQWRNQDLSTLAELERWDLQTVEDMINQTTAAQDAGIGGKVYLFRQTAQLFGYNAPNQVQYTDQIPTWSEWTTPSGEFGYRLYLDGEYADCLPGGYIHLHANGSSGATSGEYEIGGVSVAPRTAYGISNKATRLDLTQSWWSPQGSSFMSAIRGSQVHLASERLPLAPVPIEDVVTGDSITVDAAYLFLAAGQQVIVSGKRTDVENTSHTECVTIKDVWLENGRSVIEFQDSLEYDYHRSTVAINANVAPASHGETVSEILGSGDGAKSHQRFTLKQSPLTYITASTATGAASSLQVRVNDLLWQKVDSLYGCGADEQVYTIITNDDGTSTVQFGDGIHGARLPTGLNNVRADYRKGTGTAGNLVAERIDQLLVRALGVKSAVNPVIASGGDDAETVGALRVNAPLTTLTLGRVVSISDYQHFAGNFSGVSKALATVSFYAGRREILLTVGGPGGGAIDAESETHQKLLKALHDFGDPFVPVKMASFRAVHFRISGNLFVDARHDEKIVLDAVKKALLDGFCYDRRRFGQAVFLSEVIEIMQAIDGVLAVDLDALFRSDQMQALHPRLLADPPHLDLHGSMLAAELITLDPLCLDDLGVLP